MRIDLHCHSKYSKRPSLWLMQKIGCPESFSEPLALYRSAKEKGMNGVTITDHNVIDGCLELAHLSDSFVSEEVTTYFPSDECKLHVLVYDITEAQHVEIQALRSNVFELVHYLNHWGIHHVLAHPFFAVNDRLTLDHMEEALLLFKNFELNGDQSVAANALLRDVLDRLTPELYGELSDKHNLYLPFDEPWRKNLTGGSDDHSSLHLARTYTEVPGARTKGEFFEGVEEGRTRLPA